MDIILAFKLSLVYMGPLPEVDSNPNSNHVVQVVELI